MTTDGRRGRGLARATLDLIWEMQRIARDIRPCTVRAIAYQLFNRKLIASMGKNDTSRVSRQLVIARERNLIPWDWIVDEGRSEEKAPGWSDPEAFARTVQHAYRRDKWAAQPVHVAVWSEKSTVAGTLRPVLDQYEVPFQSVHGWCGATPVWNSAQANLGRNQKTIILYVGDWDPSGLGMSHDLRKRFARYSTDDPSDKDLDEDEVDAILDDLGLEIRRLALAREDTAALGIEPSFPADDKRKDSRYRWFADNYGTRCWELDALSPNVLRERVADAIAAEIDWAEWDRYVRAEEAEQETIVKTCQAWTSILGQVPN